MNNHQTLLHSFAIAFFLQNLPHIQTKRENVKYILLNNTKLQNKLPIKNK